jgi:hypothetical protein
MATLGYLFSKKTPLYILQFVTFFLSPSGKILSQKNNAHDIIQIFMFMGGVKEIIDTLCWM